MLKKILLLSFAVTLIAIGYISYSMKSAHSKNGPSELNHFIVKKSTLTRPLFFSGIIEPLNIVNVTSPVEGAVKKIYFDYGQTIEKEQQLLLLQSRKLEEEYKQALTTYAKAKKAYQTKKVSFEGTKELWAKELISRNEFEEEKSNYSDAGLTFLESEYKLDTIIKKAASIDKRFSVLELSQLDLHNVKGITQALDINLNTLLFSAPTSGIALYPGKNSGQTNNEINVGSEIKAGQVLLAIGNLNGITTTIQINEVNIGDIQVGQPVVITGAAFPGIEIHGAVASIDVQAKSGTSGLPTFPVRVMVEQLTPEQQAVVRVGMSIQVKLVLGGDSISIPVNAVYKQDDTDWVDVVDPVTGKSIPREVTVGNTLVDSVEIKSGLAIGDKVILND